MMVNLGNRTYSSCEVAFEQDLEYVMNNSIHGYSFTESKDSSLMVVESQSQQIQKYESAKQRNKLVVVGVMAIVLFSAIGILGLLDMTNSIVPVIISIVLASVAGLVAQLCVSKPEDVFTLRINNSNCRLYQLRVLADNKWCIICGANFDHKNILIDNNIIAEVKPTFSNLIIMDDVEYIQETDDDIIIHANATIRKYEPEKPYNKYTELDGKLLMDILIRHGVYPERMLEEIAVERK